MLIISHRGAAGLAPENTIASIEAAVNAGATHIEFDVHATKDHQLVAMHDESLKRTTGDPRRVQHVTLDEIKELTTLEGHSIPTLEEALAACKNIITVIEGKGENWAKPLTRVLSGRPDLQPYVVSYDPDQLAEIQTAFPRLPTYLVNKTNPFAALKIAKNNNFTGVDLIYWLYSPLIYRLAKKRNLKMIAFTVPGWYVPIMRALYPEVALTVNDPTRTGTPRAST